MTGRGRWSAQVAEPAGVEVHVPAHPVDVTPPRVLPHRPRLVGAAPLRASADPASTLRGWCEALAGAAACDGEAVWDWAYLERVSTGLFATSLGAPGAGLALLETAELLLGDPVPPARSAAR